MGADLRSPEGFCQVVKVWSFPVSTCTVVVGAVDTCQRPQLLEILHLFSSKVGVLQVVLDASFDE